MQMRGLEITGGGPRAALAVAVASIAALGFASQAGAASFGPAGAADLPQARLFDVGAADYDGDGFLDLFTTNHKTRAVLLHNDGAGNLTDRFGALGLSPSPEFPGYEYLRKPVMTDPAIYIWATDSSKEKLPGVLHLRSVGAEGSGSMVFESDNATVFRKENARATTGRTAAGRREIDFQVRDGSVIDIRVNHIDLPTSVSLRGRIPVDLPLPIPSFQPAEVRVGTRAVPAKSRRFVLSLFDRHGFAFADLVGDAATDLFMVSGGLGGDIKLPGLAGRVKDELYARSGDGFTDVTDGSGLQKGTCRGRQVAAVDIDADGRLDLFETCEGDPPKVFMRRGGGFEDFRSPASIASTYRWVNLGGRKPELLAAESKGVRVLQQTKKGWKTVQRVDDNARNGDVVQLAVSDVDSDGLIDVLAVSRSGNTLLRNTGGRLREIPIGRTGLPSRSLAASFVDFDNDGRGDVDLVPQGLYHGHGGPHWSRTGQLRVGKRAGAAITAWPDLENDGLRDPVIAYGNAEFSPRQSLLRKRNLGPGGHWLEVDLRGAAGNRQAIGARVSVRAGKRRQFEFVGQNDDSRRSQGHYRLYFGLGGAAEVDRLAVRWPNGSMTRRSNLAADRLLTIGRR
jgi:hypothetical protein